MIPLRDQELLRLRFQRDLTSRVRLDYFTLKPSPIVIPGRQQCALCGEGQTLLEELASLSERIALTVHELSESQALAESLGVDKVPATVIRGQTNRPVRFFGLPSGTMFPVFIEALLEAASGQTGLQPDSVRQLRRLKSDVHVQVLTLPVCRYSPVVALDAVKMALQNVHVKTDVVEVGEFPAIAQRYNLRGVPVIVIDERFVLPGSMDEKGLLQNVMRVAEGKPFTGETRIGALTPFTLQRPEQQAQPRTAPSGLILPN